MATRRKYEIGYKLRAIERAENGGNRQTAKALGIGEKRLRDWRKQKDSLTENVDASVRNKKRNRLPGSGRHASYPDEEETLTQWILNQREQHLRVTRNDIANYARTLITDEFFQASRGWVDNFLNRQHFSLRRVTTVGQRLPDYLYPKLLSFIQFNSTQLHTYHIALSSIGNMDETAIWSDMPQRTTIAPTGTKSIPILSTGHEKLRTTVALSAMADGRKLPPFIIFKGKRIPPDLQSIRGVVIATSDNGWMTEDLVSEYLSKDSLRYYHRREVCRQGGGTCPPLLRCSKICNFDHCAHPNLYFYY